MNPLILSDGQSLRVREFHLEVYDSKERKELSRFYIREMPFDSVIITQLGGFVTFEAISFLATHNVPILFLSPNGRLESVITHSERSLARLQARAPTLARLPDGGARPSQ